MTMQPLTLSGFAHAMAPDWKFPHEWLYWPPDVFALTSSVLRNTGCYRYTLAWSRGPHWKTNVKQAGRGWVTRISSLLAGGLDSGQIDFDAGEERMLQRTVEEIAHLSTRVGIDELRTLASPDSQRLARALITLHVIADDACTGVGMLSGPRAETALAHCLANLLLVSRGSLSVLSKHHGVVLPKVRTPQSGLTLRSLSHHLTFHQTEVEIMWRTMPWPNVEENTLNVLAVPWPYQVADKCFGDVRETFDADRCFRYEPVTPCSDADLDRLAALIRRCSTDVGKLHLVIFPELALAKSEFDGLLLRLRAMRGRGEMTHVPIVISGMRTEPDRGAPLNEVRLAAYFAGRWYDIAQRKHHRWRLDRNQIRQYRLQSRLATMRNWFEYIQVDQRRLTLFVPTGWLALCPLICEDLARLEPVSDVIRGIGPTLLAALLMDGPQLSHRWSARYASVLADDPGTAVLTLTCVGMAARAKRLEDLGKESSTRASDLPIALWKDQITGWRELQLTGGEDALLITLSAEWAEEFTLDGRGDMGCAASFRFEGSKDVSGGLRVNAGVEEGSLGPSWEVEEKWKGDWTDLRELSAATFALDAVIQLKGTAVEIIHRWLLGAETGSSHAPGSRFAEIENLLRGALREPESDGIKSEVASDPKAAWPTPSFVLAADELKRWFGEREYSRLNELQYWAELLREADARLLGLPQSPNMHVTNFNELDERRILRAVPLSVLAALHSRLESFRGGRPGVPGMVSIGSYSRQGENPAEMMETVERLLQVHGW